MENSITKKEMKLQKEKERIRALFAYEQAYYDSGYKLIAGVDEAGKGPLAGPVVAAAVILPVNRELLYVNDSKKVSEKRRELLYSVILENAVSVGVGVVNSDEIDTLNIDNATKKAMLLALACLTVVPDAVLIDGNRPPQTGIMQKSIVRGDTLSMSIASASIIAKVTRDRMMREYDIVYPEYGFARHKGYGTQAHIKAISERGLCPIHRRSFTHKFV